MTQLFVVVDYETRSEADLKAIGGYEYSTHSSTEVMCVAWRVGTKETLRTTPTYVWSPLLGDDIDAYKMLDKLIADLLNPGHMLVAHNAFFEQVITRNVLSRYIDGVKTPHRCDRAIRNIDHDRWICTAARAAALALPRNLEGACLALNLPIQKDMDGRRLLLKMCKPRKPTKNNPAKWHDTPADVARLIEYCRTDIAAEVEVFLNTPPLNETERAVWALDQKINFRGVFIDRHLVAETLKMIEVESTNMSEELTRITRGAVDKVTQRDRLLRYLHSLGARLPDLTAETVRDAIKSGEYAGDVLRLLEIKRDFGKTSTAKYSAFWFRSATDKRVRDSLLYHGASTGRWAGSGVQFQNLPRGSIKNTDLSCKLVKEGDLDAVKMVYGNAMDVFSSNIRGCVIATPGKELFCADYAAIEARVLFWVAEYDAGCKMFAEGIDLYKDMASKIYAVPFAEVTSKQRQLGKAAILGCGYGMGAVKFAETVASQGIALEGELVKVMTPKGIQMAPQLAVTIVEAYRSTHELVPSLWKKLESAAKFAINNPGKVVKICHTKWFVKNHFLWCELPSGRRLAYYKPKIVVTTEKKKGELWKKESIEHYGLNNTTEQWEPQRTWGGTLTENVVQAIARDFMADAMLRIEASGYEVILSIHDELVAERKVGEGNLKEYEELMSTVPPWGNGCPIKVEGWSAKRYRK